MIYKRGNIWWMRYSEGGKLRYVSLKTSDRAEAGLLENAHRTRQAADKAARVAQERLMRAGLAPDQAAFAWARSRWSSMNHRERQAVIFAVFKGQCTYCARQVTLPLARERNDASRAAMDHRVPFSGGGSDGFDNIVLACNDCNIKKYDGVKP